MRAFASPLRHSAYKRSGGYEAKRSHSSTEKLVDNAVPIAPWSGFTVRSLRRAPFMRLISRTGSCAAILAVAVLLPCAVAMGAAKARARQSNAEFQHHLEAIASSYGGDAPHQQRRGRAERVVFQEKAHLPGRRVPHPLSERRKFRPPALTGTKTQIRDPWRIPAAEEPQ